MNTSDERDQLTAKIYALIRDRQRREFNWRNVKVPDHLTAPQDKPPELIIRIDPDEQRP